LLIKQNLFDGVLDSSSTTNYVDFSSKGRSQFIQQLEEFIAESEKGALENDLGKLVASTASPENLSKELPEPDEIDFSEEAGEGNTEAIQESITASPEAVAESKAQEIEKVMNNGMQFLAGLFKMSTGKDLGLSGQSVEFNKETGEIVMKFKLPV
jgi:hypothetical protein